MPAAGRQPRPARVLSVLCGVGAASLFPRSIGEPKCPSAGSLNGQRRRQVRGRRCFGFDQHTRQWNRLAFVCRWGHRNGDPARTWTSLRLRDSMGFGPDRAAKQPDQALRVVRASVDRRLRCSRPADTDTSRLTQQDRTHNTPRIAQRFPLQAPGPPMEILEKDTLRVGCYAAK